MSKGTESSGGRVRDVNAHPQMLGRLWQRLLDTHALSALLVEKGGHTWEVSGQASGKRWWFNETWKGKRDFIRWRPGAGKGRALTGGRHPLG